VVRAANNLSPDVAVPVRFAACTAAWQRASRGKKPSPNQLAFEARWLDNLQDLHTMLRSRRWQGHRTASFIVKQPKTREIHAPDFSDRVVHHLLVQRLEKICELVLIFDSFASHAAGDRLQSCMRQRENMAQSGAWYLQLDIHNYFNSIHRPTLYAKLCACLVQSERPGALPQQHALALRSLCHKLLAKHTTAIERDPAAARQLPRHKRLCHAAPGCGLPVGNLTSQFQHWYAQHQHRYLRPSDVAQLQAILGSYWGHFAHANSAKPSWQLACHRAERKFLKP